MKKYILTLFVLMGMLSSCSNDDITVDYATNFKVNLSTVIKPFTYEMTPGELESVGSDERIRTRLLIYDTEGNLVDQETQLLSNYSAIMSCSKALKKGDYIAIAISDVVQYSNSKISFQYWSLSDSASIAKVPGKTISVYEGNGVTEVLDANKIKKYSIKKVNPNQSLYEQSELYDEILLNNDTSVKGIILEQDYGENGNDGYLLIEEENGSTQSIKQKDIAEYRKELNSKYDPKDDILLVKGDTRINRKEVKSARVITKYSRNSFVYDRVNLISFDRKASNNLITVEMLLVDEAQVKDLYLVKLHEESSKKHMQMDFFSDDVLFNNLKPDYSMTSVNKTTKIQYTVSQPGVYGIFDSHAKKIIPFIIK